MLRLADKHVGLRNLSEPARAIFFERQNGAATGNARGRQRLLSGTENHLLLVEQTRWNVVDLHRVDEARSVDKRFTTGKYTRKSK